MGVGDAVRVAVVEEETLVLALAETAGVADTGGDGVG